MIRNASVLPVLGCHNCPARRKVFGEFKQSCTHPNFAEEREIQPDSPFPPWCPLGADPLCYVRCDDPRRWEVDR
jgi:hypothetical protein